MDKNTIIGMLLIIGVLFCFNWFGPKRTQPADQVETEEVTSQAANATTPDNLTPTEKEWLVKNIMENGETVVLPDSTHATRLHDGVINLTAVGDSVAGTVTVDGKVLNWSDVMAADLKKMSIQEQRKAVEAVRNASVSMGRYGKFARFLSGNDSIVRLENDVISLELSAKSGSITRAELKKYDTEYTPDESAERKEKVVVFEGNSNSFDFQIPLPNPVNTADLYFTPQVLNDSTVRMALPLGNDAFWALD